ncbi:Ppx/GppA family phosphatase [Sphingomonas montanisoli]|uniref:Ppx/GppA family phosphatase n=1 Tax=Sphingomonas montanisoli TaxID=2606412 RepID=A0A5D9C1W7_9SPHN|nr:Ppx/GppA family phosphatase [Sphingomonas montanisoli]TZG25050.1 Ppx/GppA family phosphatase [Sphingomonas montanisoli]
MPSGSTLRSIDRIPKAEEGRSGIIDIGSNSIRLVIYEGPARIPAILFNEKVMAGLGKGVSRDGALDAEAMERALASLARFRRLAEQMGVPNPRTVATAAVRDASNGNLFLGMVGGLGLTVELLSGEDEARMAGLGVIAAIPGADGIVGDLGGGSLELVRITDGEIRDTVSFPLGVLRIGANTLQTIGKKVDKALGESGWQGKGEGLPFYMVGGSWRSLARVDMHLTGYPLPIVHHYRMARENAQHLVRVLSHLDRKRLREVPGLSGSRMPSLLPSAALLSHVARRLGSSELIVSAYGLREGLLYQSLPEKVRGQDPLIAAAREEGARQGRFAEHGDLLDRWIAPLFEDESGDLIRYRHAVCLLADVSWRAHPEFRAERGLDIGLHGNWVGIDARGRAMIAHALWVSFGGEAPVDVVAQLCTPADLQTAQRWGLAIRLAQRLSGGVADALLASRIAVDGGAVVLRLDRADSALYGEAVERRHRTLAQVMNCEAVLA